MQTSTYLLLFLLAIASLSCKKNATLTDATQEGANTFSCTIDGDVFKLMNKRLFGSNNMLGAAFSDRSHSFLLEANEPLREGEAVSRYIIFNIRNLQPGINYFSEERYAVVKFIPDQFPEHVDHYVANTQQDGFLNITRLDTEERIVSGTFTFTARSPLYPTNAIVVSDGRFDVRY